MYTRGYKIYTAQDRLIKCLTRDEVKAFLDNLTSGNQDKLKVIEIFDPVSGWNYADNWLKLKAQQEDLYETAEA